MAHPTAPAPRGYAVRPAKKTIAGAISIVSLIVLALVFVAGIAFTGVFNVGLAYTNEMEFCTSCHSMNTPYGEYQESMHFKNTSGVQATCSDCHVPKPFGPKMYAKVMAAKDVYHEIMGTVDTPEKFDAYRWKMANRVWAKMEASDSRECRNCHDFSDMDLSEQSRSARNKHAAAQDKGQTCIECHKGVAHEEPMEPDEPEAADAQDAA
jgi:cytochrome c-type protein NapC